MPQIIIYTIHQSLALLNILGYFEVLIKDLNPIIRRKAIMTKSIFVGNLSFAALEDEVRELFEQFGTVHSVKIVRDKLGRSRGYGFIMMNKENADRAISKLNKTIFLGRGITVNEAKDQEFDREKKAE